MSIEKKMFSVPAPLARRAFLKGGIAGLGALALAELAGAAVGNRGPANGALGAPHRAAKAKRVIFLFQAGGPSQIELFDYKPELMKRHGQEIPPSVMGKHTISGMVSSQSTFPLVRPMVEFAQHGSNGAWVSELLPHTARVVDDLCIVRSMQTDQVNHEPAVMFLQSGFPIAGRPSIGAWLSYGLGSDNANLPNFVVLVSQGGSAQPLGSAAWGSGFLPSEHQGVQFRSSADPILYLSNPDGLSRAQRRSALDALADLNHEQQAKWADPRIESTVGQYEMAYRMQMAAPDAVNLRAEPDYMFDLYGEDARKPGTFAANCLLARRLAERNVKFIQLYHTGWDHHGDLPKGIRSQAAATDQACAALVADLKQRGMLEDTLVVWGGEFGRTAFSQGQLTADNYGRDHHKGSFTFWMAGGGVRAGTLYGETDEFSYNVVKDPLHVHDFQATLLHLLGVDHEQLTFKYQGRRFRLTDVHGKVVKAVLA
jgi:hypothetical protein